jgi:hypothetical protein
MPIRSSSIASLLLVAAGLGSCAALGAPSVVGRPTPQQAQQNLARPYTEGLKFLEDYRASAGCANSEAQAVRAMVAQLEDQVRMFSVSPVSNYESVARQRHTSLAFDFAEAALKKGCLDEADGMYRHLFEFYVGAAWSGIRDRAKLGIEDVRARRAQGAAGGGGQS